MPGQKQKRRKDFAMTARRVEVARLYLARKTQREIARSLGVDQKTVCRDIAIIEADMRSRAAEIVWRRKQQIIADIDRIREEAYIAFERSKEDKIVKRVEQETGPPARPGDKPVVLSQKAIQTTEAHPGDTRHLEVALRANAEEAKLLGHYKPEKLELTAGIDLDDLWTKSNEELAQIAETLTRKLRRTTP